MERQSHLILNTPKQRTHVQKSLFLGGRLDHLLQETTFLPHCPFIFCFLSPQKSLNPVRYYGKKSKNATGLKEVEEWSEKTVWNRPGSILEFRVGGGSEGRHS